jgi:hypothetical protein
MTEDDPIKELLRFANEDELIRLAEVGLAVEMHQAAQRFFHGRTDVPYTEETAAKLQAYVELNLGDSCSSRSLLLGGRNAIHPLRNKSTRFDKPGERN